MHCFFFPAELISLDLVIEPIKNSILSELGELCFDRLRDIDKKIIETTGKGIIDLSVEAGNSRPHRRKATGDDRWREAVIT